MTLPLILVIGALLLLVGFLLARPVWVRSSVQRKALAGDADAQYRLGLFCYAGQLFPQDDGQAFEWFSKAAGQGHVKACNAVAGLYNEGRGCRKDAQKAFSFYQKSAQTGDFEGRINLAVCYLQGIGTPKNEAQGVTLLQKAAEDKSPLACTLLAQLYERGAGVPKDPKQALHYYVLAAKQGEPIAKKWLDNLEPNYLKQYKTQN